jgi:NADP-dependent 3-hydroxy acid dehydrogenase YdfG
MTYLEGRVAVVTGASSGIGRAIAMGIAGHGTRLCLAARRLERLEEVAEYTRTTASCAKSYQVDLMSDQEVLAFADSIKQDFGHVDILIHSAGVISMGRLDKAPVEDFDRQYKINVRAPYVLTQALLPIMRSCQGQIVFINSSVGLNARANVAQYAATKHALKAIADSLREEVNTDGMRVLSVFLGRTSSPMQAAVHEMEHRSYQPERLMQPEDVASVVINALNLPLTAEITDISIRPLQKL